VPALLFAASPEKRADLPSNRAMSAGSLPIDCELGAGHGVYIDYQVTDDMPSDSGRNASALARAHLLERYEAIADASQRMLDAARAADWDEVARMEERCRLLIAALKAASLQQSLPPADNRRRMDLLRRILADDAEIRGRADPWLKQFERLISSPHGVRP
jgi:flagellar protein FliT